MSEISTYVVLTACTLAVFVWLWIFEYRAYRISALRYNLFKTRDALFEAARRGDLSFDDRAYGMVRSVINGLILKADSISIPYILLVFFMCSRDHRESRGQAFEDRLTKATNKLSPAGKAAIAHARLKIDLCVVSHIAHISVLFAVPTQLVKFVLHAKSLVKRVDYNEIADDQIGQLGVWVHSQISLLEREAYAIGEYTGIDLQLNLSQRGTRPTPA